MRPIAALLVVLFLLAAVLTGCQDYWERKELERERRELQPRERELREQIKSLSADKTTFTEEEKAILGPLWIELQNIQGRMSSINDRLSDL